MRLVAIAEMVGKDTPNRFAMPICRSPDLKHLRIFKTSSGNNLFRLIPAPLAWRCFLTLSAMLSRFVPRKRCAGFTHGGLSQLCSTCLPLGIEPL